MKRVFMYGAKTPLFQALLSSYFPIQQVVTKNRTETEINYCFADSTNNTRFGIGWSNLSFRLFNLTYVCTFAAMKHLSTYLPAFFYAALATIFVVLYASNGVLNGDFLYGFERFSLLSDEPSPPELPNISEIVLLASSMFIGSFIAWQISKPRTWRIYLFCTVLSIPLSFFVTYIISMLFIIIYLVYESSECGFSLMNILNYIIASFFYSLVSTVQCGGLFILPILCSCLQSAVIMKTGVWLKKVMM
ncbi:hypothetical protein [uncultured Bacteroides sp.]|uniref:hypothetical protein n=1 Tax=uncultured Bacteroides sp. TaxID=162156 RepID=UPI0025F171CF|nr:hypothetical protein [uncultured Bacteroides sp.]